MMVIPMLPLSSLKPPAGAAAMGITIWNGKITPMLYQEVLVSGWAQTDHGWQAVYGARLLPQQTRLNSYCGDGINFRLNA